MVALDTNKDYKLYWKTNKTHITFETIVKTRGYIGFGISTNGKMFPADVIVGWVADDGTPHLNVSKPYLFNVYLYSVVH